MTPQLRQAMLFIGVCMVTGGALAGAAHYSGASLLSRFGPEEGPSQRIVLPEALSQLATAPTPSATPSDDAAGDDADPETDEAEAAPEPAPRVKPGSVFRAEGRGSLACRIPGASDFLVEWDAGKSTAVAHFSGVKVPGTLTRERVAASNTLDNRIAISREENGHRLSMTIDDSGAMRASVDGQDSAGTCNPT